MPFSGKNFKFIKNISILRKAEDTSGLVLSLTVDPTWRMKEQETDGKNIDQRWISHEYGRYPDSV